VVSRELRRNRSPHFVYEANKAGYFSSRRAGRTNKRKLLKSTSLREYVVSKLRLGWSPEQISGRIKTEKPEELAGLVISYEAIYQFIYQEEPWLYHQLRRKKPVRRYQKNRQPQRLQIPERVSIHARPEWINNRSQIGHLESDTVVGRGHKGYLSVQYERATQLVRLSRLRGLQAKETMEALEQTIESLPAGFVQSITFDNGNENVRHTEIKRAYNILTFFCDIAAPYQKGGVENANGLLRQYFPKWRDLSTVTDQEAYIVQERINNRPRKKLNYQTPNEMLQRYKVVH
jgi:IS30 family transposase